MKESATDALSSVIYEHQFMADFSDTNVGTTPSGSYDRIYRLDTPIEC